MTRSIFCVYEYEVWRSVELEVAKFWLDFWSVSLILDNLLGRSNLHIISFQQPGVKMVDLVTPLICDRMFGDMGMYVKCQHETENEDKLEDQD